MDTGLQQDEVHVNARYHKYTLSEKLRNLRLPKKSSAPERLRGLRLLRLRGLRFLRLRSLRLPRLRNLRLPKRSSAPED
ncbi:hypothetical protein L6452_31234 [Arctium lappa]|uniref:Uncharacterized protein n=1 Tax=Arctium lappa TaxID=4217 RepID=A0ACB8ZJD3_ARCLA|nr:hypothetical protein L6452_31234 [Arctium lappa]